MSKIKLGLQAHSVREAFAEDPIGTMKKVKAMGYTGLEIAMGSITGMNENLVENSAEFYRKALEETGLECYGLLTSWENVQPENIKATIQFNKDMGSPFLVIGSVPPKLVTTKEEVDKVVGYMNEIQKIINKEGIVTGYHNHDSDFTNVIDGKTFFEHVFDNTPDDFVMLLDTGNAKAGGYDSIDLIKKYPHRSSFLHVKGYSEKEGYLAYIGQDDLDWRAVLKCAIEEGDSTIFNIEFGKRGDYDPFERAENGYKVIKPILNELTKEM